MEAYVHSNIFPLSPFSTTVETVALLPKLSKAKHHIEVGMKGTIVQKLTSKDDKYACAFTDRIVAESHDTVLVVKGLLIGKRKSLI